MDIVLVVLSSQDDVGEVEDVEMEVEEAETDTAEPKTGEEIETTPTIPAPTPLVPSLPNVGANVQIRKDYDPKGNENFTCTCICFGCVQSHNSSFFSLSYMHSCMYVQVHVLYM